MGAPDAGSTPASELWDGRTVWSPGPARTDLWQGATTGGSPPTDRALELWNGTTRIADTEP